MFNRSNPCQFEEANTEQGKGLHTTGEHGTAQKLDVKPNRILNFAAAAVGGEWHISLPVLHYSHLGLGTRTEYMTCGVSVNMTELIGFPHGVL